MLREYIMAYYFINKKENTSINNKKGKSRRKLIE